MQKNQGNLAKIGMLCTVFCTLAGWSYGLLESCCTAPEARTARCIVFALAWTSVGYFFTTAIRERDVQRAFAMLIVALCYLATFSTVLK